jgi:hypothetical protein
MHRSRMLWLAVMAAGLALSGCGRFRGIPAHGGGKRFFVEQELVAATARAAARDVDVSHLRGKRCALYVISMGDEGAGVLTGGRYSLDALIRGSYDSTGRTYTDSTTASEFPTLPGTSTAVTTDGVGALISTTNTNSTAALNAANRSETKTESFTRGFSQGYGGGARLAWPGEYRAEAFINPRDAQFLEAVINEAMALKGVLIVPPQQAEADVFVTIDVFGTCRDRYEYWVYNREVLQAKTGMSVCAFSRKTGEVIMPPTPAVFEAEYCEEFIAWCGPVTEAKTIRRAEDLLVTFEGLATNGGVLPERSTELRPAEDGDERTRPKDLTQPLPKPDPNRPEDLP